MFKNLKKLLKKTAPKKRPAKKAPVKKAVKKAAAKKKVSAKKKVAAKPALKVQKPIGKVLHFYGEIKVAIVKFSAPPKIGKEVRFEGATTRFSQAITSAQYDHKPLKVIPKGKQVGIKVRSRVREGDAVYLVK